MNKIIKTVIAVQSISIVLLILLLIGVLDNKFLSNPMYSSSEISQKYEEENHE